MFCQVMPGGQHQFLLFARGNARGGSPKMLAAAQPDLDENDFLAVLHYQIDFTETAAVIALQQAQTATLQKMQSGMFSVATGIIQGSGSAKTLP